MGRFFFPSGRLDRGPSVVAIGWVVGAFGVVWGASQLWTGPLSDRLGRKAPIVAGMWLCGAGVAVAGVGMALLYPTLIAAVSDISHPNWRGSSLGVYRFWRDTGYGIGALALGLAADASGAMETGFWLTAVAMGLSGLWVLIAAEETHPRLNPAPP